MRLVEFLHQIDEAKFRKPAVMYHGTSSSNLRSILKQGIIPDPQEKVWATDPDISPHSFSRASLGGSYWSNNLMTATSASTTSTYQAHFGGSAIMVVAQISEGSAFADEDDLNFKINWSLGHMYDDLFGGGLIAEVVPKASSLYYWGEGKQKEMIEAFGESLHSSAAIDPKKQPINWNFMKELLEAVMIRQMAYVVYEQERSTSYYKDRYVQEMERLHGEGQAPAIPPIEEAENTLLKLRDILTRTYRKTVYPEKKESVLRNTLRTTQPVTFRGANRILAIIGDQPREKEEGVDWWKKPKILYYGTPPDDYFKQYRESVGAFPGAINTKGQLVIPPVEKEKVAASVGSNEGETYADDDPNLDMNPKKIVPTGSALADAGTSSGWDWMDATHGYERGSMSMVEQREGLLGPHQGREFEFLMSGKKKFAMPDLSTAEQDKDKYQDAVRKGKLIYTKWKNHHFFATPGNEWRIKKAIEIYQEVKRDRYMTDAHHTALGKLLGYSDEEIEAFVNPHTVNEAPYQTAFLTQWGSQTKGYVETYENPSSRELMMLARTSPHDDIRAFIIGDTVLAWASMGALHIQIAEQFNLPNTVIPIIFMVDRSDMSAVIIVTDYVRKTNWYHNPETANAIKSNGYISSSFKDIEISYFDEDIVGDWEDPDFGEVHESEEDDAEEAIGTYKTIGDFDKPTIGFRKAADRRMISNPVIQQKTRDKFARTDHPFNFYFVNLPGRGKHIETGMVGRDWLDENMPEVSKEVPTDNMHVNMIFVGNQAAEWRPMTPWIMAHRIAHAFQSQRGPSGRKGQIYSYKEAGDTLIRTTNYIFQNAYGKSAVQPQRAGGYAGWESIRFDQRTFKFFWQNVATFRSAREGKIRDWFEVIHELFAQYLTTGKIKFGPLPKSLTKRQAFKHAGIYIGFKGNEHDYEYFNGMMGDLADELEAYFDNAIGEATGHFFVM